ncbi:hypothetical protein A1O3_06574 [Capronia epimyces CBS 606.96]|uniref:Oxidoreductase n=1 Tax=Capronia epimyces CBS 606.96 TaxID=1182542 RepID=W9YKG8_9EURO|nr:uncharacterized protein A1O3_06574 [Capronia epimyces CBS 606.96]EXJ82759.1 hypothetical protein A1O3_06574 [Capronia epimyces CBS 606.96]
MTTFTRETTGVEVVNALADRVDGKTSKSLTLLDTLIALNIRASADLTSLTDEIVHAEGVVITGASNNTLGGETAEALAHANPAHLILLARSQPRVEAVILRIKALNPKVKVTFVPVSLDDFDSVRAAAATVSGAIDKLDILINNAGIMAVKEYTTNKDGIELQFATNHLGHFLFTKRLFPKILAAGPGARIVNLTSLGHKLGPVRFDDPNFSNGAAYDPWSGYGQSKTANILFTVGLANKLRERKIASFAVHPGAIFNTNLATHLNFQDEIAAFQVVALKNTGRPFPFADDPAKPIEQGITTTLVAALDPSIEAQSGSYLADAHIQDPYEYASSKENADRLWKLSEELVGEKFDI